MVTDPCVIRNYRQTDADHYVRFYAEAESVCRSDDTFLVAALTGESPAPAGFSHEDLFLAEDKGRIVGACRVIPEQAIERAVLRFFIMPDYIERGIADRLLRSTLKRAADYRVANVHADLREHDQAARVLFAGIGFRPVRRYTDMTLDLASASIPKLENYDLVHRSLEPGDEEKLTRLQNLAFGGSWGFCPNTTPETAWLLNVRGYGHEGAIMTYRGDDVVGYCWTAEIYGSGQKDGAVLGRIHMMGIMPAFRGRGLGKYILWSGLKHLAGKGIHSVELTMDNENPAARSLYERAGFKPETALLWYEKAL
jgi:mycothiol synthase